MPPVPPAMASLCEESVLVEASFTVRPEGELSSSIAEEVEEPMGRVGAWGLSGGVRVLLPVVWPP